MNYVLTSHSPLTQLLHQKGVNTWQELLHYLRQLPYGRTTDRNKLSLVIKEEKGTCSSKHALLKSVADENEIAEVKLMLCLYNMSAENTPGIGSELADNGLKYIPEAHCYISVGEEKIDITNEHSDLSRIADQIIEEIEIKPVDIGEFKIKYHQDFLRMWANQVSREMTYERAWNIREACIENLQAAGGFDYKKLDTGPPPASASGG